MILNWLYLSMSRTSISISDTLNAGTVNAHIGMEFEKVDHNAKKTYGRSCLWQINIYLSLLTIASVNSLVLALPPKSPVIDLPSAIVYTIMGKHHGRIEAEIHSRRELRPRSSPRGRTSSCDGASLRKTAATPLGLRDLYLFNNVSRG